MLVGALLVFARGVDEKDGLFGVRFARLVEDHERGGHAGADAGYAIEGSTRVRVVDKPVEVALFPGYVAALEMNLPVKAAGENLDYA